MLAPVITSALLAVAGLGVVVVLVMLACQWWVLARSGMHPDMAELPPVSVLKPLKGVDADLEANLGSFLRLDYPDYEVLLGVQDPGDPALAVAREIAALDRRVKVVVDGREIGYNPKVNNLANLLAAARHDLLVISDSNVAVGPTYLRRMVERLRPEVGLVTSVIRGTGGRGLGGALEALQLNTFVMGGVASVNGVAGRVCAVGKSMLLRRRDLDRIGGMAELGRYLAEDQVCGEAIRALGLEVVVSPDPVDNVLGPVTVGRFVARHLRWARIRRRMSPLGYTSELLAYPLAPALAAAALEPGRLTLTVLAAVALVTAVAAALAEARLGVSRRRPLYLLLEPLRALLLAALWPVPFLGSTVRWRGRTFRIGPRTLLEPLGDDAGLTPALVEASEHAAA